VIAARYEAGPVRQRLSWTTPPFGIAAHHRKRLNSSFRDLFGVAALRKHRLNSVRRRDSVWSLGINEAQAGGALLAGGRAKCSAAALFLTGFETRLGDARG
jgi:hypothetical protein